MASYWVYLNEEVKGPFGVDQLIRLRGFSRQTLVCIDEPGGKAKNWISPAEIPELAHIFKAADEHHAEAAPAPKAAAKAPARAAKPFVPAVTLRAPKRNMAQLWGWILLAAAVLGGGALVASFYSHRNAQNQDRVAARQLIENVHLPAPSPYATLPQYFQEKNLTPKWEFEKKEEQLYDVTVSWYAPTPNVYAFEVNLQAQTVRGLNSAASKLLSEGFPAPASRKAKEAPAPKKSAGEQFSSALDTERTAVEGGDYQTVWDSYSARKKSEMAKGGISRDGFIRLQGLTHKVEAGVKQDVLKTKSESDTERLVLIKQTQENHPDVFIKQLWILEDGAWKLDDEQKKSSTPAAAPEPPAAPSAVPPTPTASPETSAPTTKPTPASLPGMSN